VTHALETHKTLTGEDVEAVIEGRRGPLIDGRVYATKRFAAVAEEYHEQVVEAHESHGQVYVPLPVLDPIIDDDLMALPVVAGANGDAPHERSPWAGPYRAPDPTED
jgi:cell division protease FtsH